MKVINGIRKNARVDVRSVTSVLKDRVSRQFAEQVSKICDDKKSSLGLCCSAFSPPPNLQSVWPKAVPHLADSPCDTSVALLDICTNQRFVIGIATFWC